MNYDLISASKKNTIILGLAVLAIAVSAYNATLIFDDLYLVGGHFGRIESEFTGWGSVRYIVLNLDLAPQEYRLYGLSRLLHFGLWKCFGTSPVPYAIWIVTTQILSGYGISRLLLRGGANALQADAAWTVWVFSAFAVTSCFHHYSYLILPYQITILCAVLIRWRLVSFLLGIFIALTGEVHLPAACLMLVLVARSPDRARKAWISDLAIPLAAIVGTVIAHRILWNMSIPYDNGVRRYNVGINGLYESFERTGAWVSTLVPGMASQIAEIVSLSGGAALFLLFGIILGASVRGRDVGGSNRVAIALFAVAFASFTVLWALSASTGQISPILPRRYGYVPYTLCVMSVVVLLFAPGLKRVLGTAAGATVLAIVLSLWGMLQFEVLRTVRVQDKRVWDVVLRTLAAKGPSASILFVSASHLDYLKRSAIVEVNSIPFRAPSPDILESAFQGYWWESQYAVVFAHAAFSAYKWDDVDDQNIKLFGNGLNGMSSRTVNKSSVVVLFDEQRAPGDPRRVSTYTDWERFQSAFNSR